MKNIGFFIFKAFAWFVAYMPMRIQYFISDIIYGLIYYIVGYRKKVAYNNIRNSFPDISDKEIKRIRKAYYHHLVDIMIEIIAMMRLTEADIEKRQKLVNIELLDELYKQNKGVIGVTGHYNNWEWFNYLETKADYKGLAIYKPISDKNFEKFVNDIREKFGAIAVPMKDTIRQYIIQKRKKELPLLIMVGDQSPPKSEIQYWTNFLNQDTPVYLGAEKLAVKLDYAVIFIKMKKIKRGYYETSFELITDKPQETKEYEITNKHVQILENMIKEQPEYWAWTHKRWKHTRDK